MSTWPSQVEENKRKRRARIARTLDRLMREEHVLAASDDEVDGRLRGLVAWLDGIETVCHVCGRSVDGEATINGACDKCRP